MKRSRLRRPRINTNPTGPLTRAAPHPHLTDPIMNARIRTAAAMPRETEITIQCKSPLHGKWQPAETLTLEAWMQRASDNASRADHELDDQDPAACLEYLLADVGEYEIEAA